MFERLDVTTMAHASAAHAAARQGVVARNIAHADTPGYRAMDVEDFATAFRRLQQTAERPGAGALAPRLLPMAPSGSLSPNGNSVSIEAEMRKAVEVRQQFDMALGIYQTVSGILRTSLGR